jgi:lipopolysaccharide export system permease protein
VVLALAGVASPLRFPRGGLGLLIGASGVVFSGYYVSLIAGESLADRLVISPFLAMWMTNALLLAIVLLLVWRRGTTGARWRRVARNRQLATAIGVHHR